MSDVHAGWSPGSSRLCGSAVSRPYRLQPAILRRYCPATECCRSHDVSLYLTLSCLGSRRVARGPRTGPDTH
eukprot:2475769-Prymnesium_polylepis.2